VDLPGSGSAGLEKVDWTAQTEKPFRLEVRGTYGVRVIDPEVFAASMLKAGAATPHQIQRTLESVITNRLTSMIRASVDSPHQLEARFGEVAVETRLGVKQQFSRMGLDLVDFLVLSINPEGNVPPEAPRRGPKQTRRPRGNGSRPRVGRAQELKFPRGGS